MKEGWNKTKLADVATCQIGLTYKPTDVVDEGGTIVLRSSNIQDSKITLNDIVRVHCDIKPSKYVKDGDILMCSRNGSFRLVGKVAKINKLAENMSFGAFMTIIRSEYNEYLFYFFQSQSFRKQIFVGQTATINQITTKMLNNTHVKIPPLSEQQHIVEELDLLSSIIEKKKTQLNELDNLAQSLFYEMFGDPIINNMEWEVKTLKELVYIGLGFTHTPQYVEKGVPFISVKDISSGYIDLSKIKYVSKEEYDNAPKGAKPQKGDLMFCRVGTMGKPLIVETDMQFCTFVSVGYMRRLQNNIDMSFLKYWMLSNSFDKQVEANVRGLAIKNLNTGWLKNFSIYLPPLSIQQQFAEKVEAIEHQKELIKQSIDEVETLFNSRMDYYFN